MSLPEIQNQYNVCHIHGETETEEKDRKVTAHMTVGARKSAYVEHGGSINLTNRK